MSIGTHVIYTDPKTHKQRTGVLDHVATMRSGFVAAFIRPDGEDRIITVAVTAVQSQDAI